MAKTIDQAELHVLLTKFTHAQFVKMVTKLLLSLSVFSFLFSQSSLLSLARSLNFCLSTFPYQLLTHTIDKNFMFLLCNGLVVFLAKYSGLIRSLSSLSTRVDQSDPEIVDVSRSEHSTTMSENEGVIALDNVVGLEDNVAPEEVGNEEEIETEKAILGDEEYGQVSEFKDSDEEEKDLIHVAEDIYEDGIEEEEDEEKHIIDWSNGSEEEEEEEEEEIGNGKLSTEEMDKKFDEFIRRMKENLRVEAQRQLIMV